MNRSLDWLHQAQADLAQAQLSADGGHHEWAGISASRFGAMV
jgi:HEPN domain-containing protein